MPYTSKSQQRYFHAAAARGDIDPKTVKEWDEKTKNAPGGFKKLPEKVKTMKKSAFWSGFAKQASFMTPAEPEVAAPDAAGAPQAQAQPQPQPMTPPPPPRRIQKFNHLGGIDPRTPEDMQIAQSVNLVTLPADVPEGGASCSTCVHFNPNGPQSGEGVCSSPQVMLPVTTRMVCSQWDSPGAHRSWDTEEVRQMGVSEMDQESDAAMAEDQAMMQDPNMAAAEGGEPMPAQVESGADSGHKKPVDSTPTKPKKAKKEPSNAATNVHVHVGGEKKASLGTHGAEVLGLGTLAIPSIQKLRGKPMSPHAEDATELAGLGILAIPSSIAIGKAIKDKIPALAKMVRR